MYHLQEQIIRTKHIPDKNILQKAFHVLAVMGLTTRQLHQHRPARVRKFSIKGSNAARQAAQVRWGGKENRPPTVSTTTSTTQTATQGTSVPKPKLEGARIIPLQKLGSSIEELSSHSAECGGACTITKESRSGLASTLYLACLKCGEEFTLQSSSRVRSECIGRRWTVNVGAVWGQMATRGGAARLNETMATMEVPGLS